MESDVLALDALVLAGLVLLTDAILTSSLATSQLFGIVRALLAGAYISAAATLLLDVLSLIKQKKPPKIRSM